jgi:hypothetical protein
VSGVSWGDFALPDSLPQGNYRIRAYTRWMQNEGEGAYFEKVIPIGSVHAQKVPESTTAKLVRAKADLQFFPEGGELVAGINSRIAFKAIGTNGLGINFSGNIIDDAGKTIASISPTHMGMGYFNLTAQEGKTYKAEVTYADGSKDDIHLPSPVEKGVSLSVNNDSLQTATIKIEANKAYYSDHKGEAYTVLVWSGGYTTTVNCKLDSAVITMDLIKRRLFTGVTRITLFSANNEPLCERLIFNQNYDQLNLDASADKGTYKTRNRIEMKLNARTKADSLAVGHFAVSVTDESKVESDENNETTILSDLLLTSDLKGYVEQPNYYFTDITPDKLKNLDLVMLTHGYRHFTWKQVLDSANTSAKYLAESGISINGTATNLFGKPAAKARVALLTIQKTGFITDTADNKGNFHFNNLLFADTAKFMLQAATASGKNTTKLIYKKDEIPPLNTPVASTFVTDAPTTAYLKNAEEQQALWKAGMPKTRMLKEVKIETYRSSNILGPGHADQVLHAKDFGELGGQLGDRLNGKLHGVVITNGHASLMGSPMAIYLDYMEIPDLNRINPNDIETVEVLKFTSASIYGIGGGNGVIVLTSKLGGSRASDIASIGVLPIEVPGFHRAREFYSPKYDASLPSNPKPDLRSTIYWNPSVVTDKEGNASFDFYSADAPGNYRVVIEGMDNKGNLGRKVVHLKVD